MVFSDVDIECPRREAPYPLVRTGSYVRDEDPAIPTREPGYDLLIVDDAPRLLKFYCDLLQRNGFSVRHARDGYKALGVVEEHGLPGLLCVTDIQMPGLDGHTLTTLLQERDKTLPVLQISGGNFDWTSPHYLAKPFAAPALMHKISEIARLSLDL